MQSYKSLALALVLMLPTVSSAAAQKQLLGQHARVISKMVGSDLTHGHADDLRCQWSEASVEDGRQSCTYLGRDGNTKQLVGIKASFMIDSVLGTKTAKADCREGLCQLSVPQEVNCYSLGAQGFGLQCRVTALSAP